MGKSTVSSIFRKNNFKVWDADFEVHNLYKKGKEGYKSIVSIYPELKDRVDYCGEDEKFEDLTSCVHGYVLVERVKELLKEDGYSDENIEAIFHRINTVVEFR